VRGGAFQAFFKEKITLPFRANKALDHLQISSHKRIGWFYYLVAEPAIDLIPGRIR
jgi:hypothetical protein